MVPNFFLEKYLYSNKYLDEESSKVEILIKKIFNMLFSVLRQSIFILSNTLKKFKDNNVNALSRDGFISLKNFFPSNYCDDFLKKYYIDEVAEENYISKYKTITKSELEYIINTLKQKGIIDIIKEYLEKIICYDNSILFLGNKTSEKESWMPHHDIKKID